MVTLHVTGEVATVTLGRVQARNAIDPAWVDALAVAVGELAATGPPALRAVLIRADGPAFTVGGDLKHFAAHPDQLTEELRRMITSYHDSLRTIAELPVPVVCAAQGAVAGGGLGLLWAADVVLLADDARLATSFDRLGLSGDGGSSWYLPRLVGLRRASQLLILGRTLTAQDALAWDLADEVVARSELDATAAALARRLASGPTLAYAEIRRNLRSAFARDLGAGLDAELASILRTSRTADAQEGIAAFTGRRSPTFDAR